MHVTDVLAYIHNIYVKCAHDMYMCMHMSCWTKAVPPFFSQWEVEVFFKVMKSQTAPLLVLHFVF